MELNARALGTMTQEAYGIHIKRDFKRFNIIKFVVIVPGHMGCFQTTNVKRQVRVLPLLQYSVCNWPL